MLAIGWLKLGCGRRRLTHEDRQRDQDAGSSDADFAEAGRTRSAALALHPTRAEIHAAWEARPGEPVGRTSELLEESPF